MKDKNKIYKLQENIESMSAQFFDDGGSIDELLFALMGCCMGLSQSMILSNAHNSPNDLLKWIIDNAPKQGKK
jgi:hypothetical protein